MNRSSVIGLSILLILLAGWDVAFAMVPGAPGSPARRVWCEHKLEACRAMAKSPGFLGGARNYCNSGTDKPDCVGVCEQDWGPRSSCLTAPRNTSK
jgi:hypothetical protein